MIKIRIILFPSVPNEDCSFFDLFDFFSIRSTGLSDWNVNNENKKKTNNLPFDFDSREKSQSIVAAEVVTRIRLKWTFVFQLSIMGVFFSCVFSCRLCVWREPICLIVKFNSIVLFLIRPQNFPRLYIYTSMHTRSSYSRTCIRGIHAYMYGTRQSYAFDRIESNVWYHLHMMNRSNEMKK